MLSEPTNNEFYGGSGRDEVYLSGCTRTTVDEEELSVRRRTSTVQGEFGNDTADADCAALTTAIFDELLCCEPTQRRLLGLHVEAKIKCV